MELSKLKKTGLYSAIRKGYKEFRQNKAIGKIEIPRNIDNINIQAEFDGCINKTKKYVEQMTLQNWGKFAASSDGETVYAFSYLVMLYGLLGMELTPEQEEDIKTFLVKSQQEDGYFYDKKVFNYAFVNGDGWGMRHLIPHVIIAMERLAIKPRYRLEFLKSFYEYDTMYDFIEQLDWSNAWTASNFVMNIAVCLQYERDFMGVTEGTEAIKAVQDWILNNIGKKDIWYTKQKATKATKYEIVRCAYHLLPVLVYDGIDVPYKKEMIDLILSLQNKVGGFDFRKNSSACEDIDAIDPLIRLSYMCPDYRREDIKRCLKKAFMWVKQNQMPDGGYVFRRGERFNYGHKNVSSNVNESNLFGTWFRTLSILYMSDYLLKKQHNYLCTPGYEYPLENVER